MRLIHLICDSDGNSQFGEDVELELTPQAFAPPAPDLEVSAPVAASQMEVLRFPAGWVGPAHPSPTRQMMAFIVGELEVTAGGQSRRIVAGDIVLLEDNESTGHETTALVETIAIAVKL